MSVAPESYSSKRLTLIILVYVFFLFFFPKKTKKTPSTQSELFCPLQTFMSPLCRTGAPRCCTYSLMFSQLVRCVREANTPSLQGSNSAFVFVYRGPSLFASLFPLICIFHEQCGLADCRHHAFFEVADQPQKLSLTTAFCRNKTMTLMVGVSQPSCLLLLLSQLTFFFFADV